MKLIDIKDYRTPLMMGLIIAFLLGVTSFDGYGVFLYYGWWALFFALLVLATPTFKRKPSVTTYLCAFVILLALSTAGAVAGHLGRMLQCRNKCKACEPLLALLQEHHNRYGQYPLKLSEVQGFAVAQRDTGLDVAQGEFSRSGINFTGINLVGINSHDALIYLDTNFVSCVVPVTKQLPVSITRFYIYGWNSDTPSWKYEKVIRMLDGDSI